MINERKWVQAAIEGIEKTEDCNPFGGCAMRAMIVNALRGLEDELERASDDLTFLDKVRGENVDLRVRVEGLRERNEKLRQDTFKLGHEWVERGEENARLREALTSCVQRMEAIRKHYFETAWDSVSEMVLSDARAVLEDE